MDIRELLSAILRRGGLTPESPATRSVANGLFCFKANISKLIGFKTKKPWALRARAFRCSETGE